MARAHHARESEITVGFYKKGSGKKSITFREALDEALCFGWIDGVRHSIDEERYVNRSRRERRRATGAQSTSRAPES